jgi:hypothetical protein
MKANKLDMRKSRLDEKIKEDGVRWFFICSNAHIE